MAAYIELQDLFRFIQPEELSVYCGFSPNVRIENILPQIQLAQNLKLKVSLGDTLYEKLKAEFIAAGYNPNNLVDGTTNADGINYKLLYEKSFMPLVWWTAFYSMAVVAIKIEEKGIMINTSDYSENTSFDGLKLKEDRCRKTAEEYTEILYDYINCTFKQDDTFQEESKDEGKRFCGMYFPKNVNSSKNNKFYKQSI